MARIAAVSSALASQIVARGVDLLYPPQCACCGADCAGRLLLCLACRAACDDTHATCPRCAADMPAGHADSGLCPHCRNPAPRFQAAVRLSRYEGLLRTAILRIKHATEQPLAAALADWFVERRAAALELLELDVVVPMPMHWMRRCWRGMNNPDLLAARLAQRLQLPLAPRLLVRRRSTRPQTGLPRSRRLLNVRGAFRVRQHPDLPGARVLLVDDVMTTGATAGEAARMFRRAGAAFVAVAVLARAEGLP